MKVEASVDFPDDLALLCHIFDDQQELTDE